MNRSIEHSFKARMRATSLERRVAASEIWEVLALERFLVRLGRSHYTDRFVLKGGLLLSRYMAIGRHTQDLDFLLNGLRNDRETLTQVLIDILAVEVDDGFAFLEPTLTPLAHPHMKYIGTRASIPATFGKTRFKLLIDIGCGDLVEPVKQVLPLLGNSKGPLFESHVELSCYPPEFIFAEKLEAIVYLESRNSRMKDFHDIYSMVRTNLVEGDDVDRIVRLVFSHRGTPLRFPLSFTAVELETLQSFWTRHLESGLVPDISLPDRMEEVLAVLNQWLAERTSLCSWQHNQNVTAT